MQCAHRLVRRCLGSACGEPVLAENSGCRATVAYETSAFGVTIALSSQRSFGPYDDLASVTARLQAGSFADPQTVLAGLSFTNPYGPSVPSPGSFWLSARAPKALDHISIGLPLPFDLSTLSASFIHLNDAAGRVSNILSASWSRGLPYSATAFATAFTDLGDRKNCGFLVGLSIPLGESVVRIGRPVARQERHRSDSRRREAAEPAAGELRLAAARQRGRRAGSLGVGCLSFRLCPGRVGRASGWQPRPATAEIEGAVVTMGNGVFLANRIDDGFAVVDTGVAGVEVFHENRSIGFTDANGRALIPALRSYQKNKIAIDTRNLPVDADISTTQEVVAPADRSGVRVDFTVRTNTSAAVLLLTTPDGRPVPAGSQGKIEGGEAFFVGYDGRAWVKGLASRNALSVSLAERECHASFAYSARQNEQVVIPVVCE